MIQTVGERDEGQELAEEIKNEGVTEEPIDKVEGHDELVELSDDEVQQGKREVRKFNNPKLPSEKEVQEHYASGHMPFRNWCHHRVRGRGREWDHRRTTEDRDQGIPEYHMDYCFPGDDKNHMTVLVVVERYTKMKKAVAVPSKGATGNFATKMVLDLVRECGDDNRDIILKTDQENAIKFLVDDICTARTGASKDHCGVGTEGQQGVEWDRREGGAVGGAVPQNLEVLTRRAYEGQDRLDAPRKCLALRVHQLHDEPHGGRERRQDRVREDEG